MKNYPLMNPIFLPLVQYDDSGSDMEVNESHSHQTLSRIGAEKTVKPAKMRQQKSHDKNNVKQL